MPLILLLMLHFADSLLLNLSFIRFVLYLMIEGTVLMKLDHQQQCRYLDFFKFLAFWCLMFCYYFCFSQQLVWLSEQLLP